MNIKAKSILLALFLCPLCIHAQVFIPGQQLEKPYSDANNPYNANNPKNPYHPNNNPYNKQGYMQNPSAYGVEQVTNEQGSSSKQPYYQSQNNNSQLTTAYNHMLGAQQSTYGQQNLLNPYNNFRNIGKNYVTHQGCYGPNAGKICNTSTPPIRPVVELNPLQNAYNPQGNSYNKNSPLNPYNYSPYDDKK